MKHTYPISTSEQFRYNIESCFQQTGLEAQKSLWVPYLLSNFYARVGKVHKKPKTEQKLCA